MFSKVHPKAIIIGTIVLVAVALVTYVLPIIGLILCLFATIPGIIMWHKSIATFGIGFTHCSHHDLIREYLCIKCHDSSFITKFCNWPIIKRTYI